MEALEKTFTFLHIRTYNKKLMKFCVRKIILTLFASFFFIYLVRFVQCIMFACSAIQNKSLLFGDIKDLFTISIVFTIFGYLVFYWIITWKKADYMISRAVHAPFDKGDKGD